MICLIGGKGSIGQRYACIMRNFNIPHVIFDLDTPEVELYKYNKFIIATPTETHAHFLNELKGATILCEKPVSKNPSEIPTDKNLFVVNNYQYVARLMVKTEPYFISYDYYRSGKDGLFWDACQLIYMDPDCSLETRSHKWNCSINGSYVQYRTLEESYVRMIVDFHKGIYKNLWNMQVGLEMTNKVIERIKIESSKKSK